MSNVEPNKVFRSRWERLLGETDSPIEATLLEALCARAVDRGYEVAREPRANDTLAIKLQKQVDKYSLDLALTFHFHGEVLQLDIEADGHDFHERTRSQARHDRQRDRALGALGYDVLRFTGSEIYDNPGLCAAEIMNRIEAFQSDRIVRHMKEMP